LHHDFDDFEDVEGFLLQTHTRHPPAAMHWEAEMGMGMEGGGRRVQRNMQQDFEAAHFFMGGKRVL